MLKLSKSLAIESCRRNSSLKLLPAIAPSLGLGQTRLKSDINFEWVPPPTIPCIHPSKSGDRSPLPEVDKTRLKYKFAISNIQLSDRQDLSPEVKKLATLEFASHNEQVQAIKHETLSKLQRHALDTGTSEAMISCLTIRIRSLQKHMEKNRTDVICKVALKELIERRNGYLKHLRRFDYKRYEWLLEKLDLVFYAPINGIEKITRKGALRKLTAHYCETMRKERLEAYKSELEKEKAAFAKEKEEQLKWIQNEEQELQKLLKK